MIASAYVAYLLAQRFVADRMRGERPEAAREPPPGTTRRPGRWLWLGAGAALALLAAAILPNIGGFCGACGTLVNWSIAHWSCPQPVEASPIAACGPAGFPSVS